MAGQLVRSEENLGSRCCDSFHPSKKSNSLGQVSAERYKDQGKTKVGLWGAKTEREKRRLSRR